MKKTFVIQVEYPDCDTIHSDELIEVTKESLEYILSRYFGANIMDGDYDRIKVKEVTNGFSLVKRMREAQIKEQQLHMKIVPTIDGEDSFDFVERLLKLESEVDEYLKKMEI